MPTERDFEYYKSKGRVIPHTKMTVRKGTNFGNDAVEWTGDKLFGGDAAQASRDAARLQEQSGRRAGEYATDAYQQGQAGLSPYAQQGQDNFNTFNSRMGQGYYNYEPERYQYGQEQPGMYQAGQRPGAYQSQALPGMFDASGYQGPAQFQAQQGPANYQAQQAPGQFNKAEYDTMMPGQFSFSAQDYQQSPEAKLLMDQGSKAMERSAAAAGGLASGATLGGLQQLGQDITAKDFGNQFNRAAQTHGMQLDQALGERGFGYGMSRDQRGDYNTDRSFGFGVNQADIGRSERDRGFGYNQRQDQQAEMERNRLFGYGMNQDEYGRAIGQQNFGYQQNRDQQSDFNLDRTYATGQNQEEYNRWNEGYNRGYTADQDYQNRIGNELGLRYARDYTSGMMGPEMAMNQANFAQQYGQNMGNIEMGIGNAQAAGRVGAANALQQGLGQWLNFGSQIGGSWLGGK